MADSVISCQIEGCNQSISEVEYEDHFLAHQLQYEYSLETPPTEGELEISNAASLQADEAEGDEQCNDQEQTNSDSMIEQCSTNVEIDPQELKEGLKTIVRDAETELTDMKTELSSMGQELKEVPVKELVEGLSGGALEEVVDGLKSEIQNAASGITEIQTEMTEFFKKDIPEEITVGVVFSVTKAVAGAAKDWWKERKEKKAQVSASSQNRAPTVPMVLPSESMAMLSLASETLIQYISELVQKLNISENLLDEICSDEHICEIARFMGNWKDVADELLLDEHDIADIEQERNSLARSRRTLKRWKQKFAYAATYRSLLEIFLKLNRRDYAKALGELLSGIHC